MLKASSRFAQDFKWRRYKWCLKCWLISELWALSLLLLTRTEVCGLPACVCVPRGCPPCAAGQGRTPGPRSPWGLALAAHPLLCRQCPGHTEATSVPFVPDCSCQNVHFSRERGLLLAFCNNTLNVVVLSTLATETGCYISSQALL